MDDPAKVPALPLSAEADSLPGDLPVPSAEHANTLALLYEVSREVTSILNRDELLRRIENGVKRLVNHQVFSVMLWNESEQVLESVFTVRHSEAIGSHLRMRLGQGLTGIAAAEQRAVRVGDVLNDPRYIRCETGV